METEQTDPKSPAGNIDLATCKNGVIRVVGWMFWSESEPRLATIHLRSAAAGSPDIPLPIFPDQRPDVNEYLGINNDIETGFSGRCLLDSISISDLPVGHAEIIASDPKGEFTDRVIGGVNIEWPQAPYQVTDPSEAQAHTDSQPVNLKQKPPGFFNRLWNGSAGGNTSLLELSNEESITAANLLHAFDEIEASGGLAAQRDVIGRLLGLAIRLKTASENNGLNVIIDHNYGGGANTFSTKLTAQYITAGNGVLRLWHNVAKGVFGGEYITQNEKTEIAIDSANLLFRLLEELPSFALQLNSIWTYPDTYQFLDNVLRLRLFGYTKRLEFFAHDHMPVCPSLFLLNHKSTFCGVPDDTKSCTNCLKRNRLDFKSYYPQTDIEAWRTAWQSLLINCDLIRFFSDSTRSNYIRAYPWLAENQNVVVTGHDVKDLWPIRYSRDRALANKAKDEGLKIAVFGFISEHKGSRVLKSMSDAIIKQKDKTRILVFGSLEGKTYGRSGAIDLMGPYAPVEMLDICEDNGIDIAFMPSICPETFSFSTKELTLVGVPVASFGFGGQADIVHKYEKGHIVKHGTGLSLLRQFKSIAKADFQQKA